MKETNSKSETFWPIFLKASLLSLLFAIIMLAITAFGVGIWGFNKLNNFTKTADTSIAELKTTLKTGWNTQATHTDYKKNILLLGVDSLESRPGSPALTDTVMILSLNLKSGEISRISLPRDLWSEDYKTRINALYFYGQDKYPERPEQFAEEVVEDLTGVDVHHTIVISIESVTEIIDILGGIEIDVEHGFTDTQFPRSDVDVTKIFDPEKLYQTISFDKGIQKMDGERVQQFIRSRKSENDEGDDIARSERQQLVLYSILQTITNFDLLKNTETLAELYKYYNANFSQQFSVKEGISSIKAILPVRENLSFISNSISIYPEDKFGVITNPPTYKYSGEWVYEIRDRYAFRDEILEKLNIKDRQ
jgi:LCP family protein required for cell wall assembly